MNKTTLIVGRLIVFVLGLSYVTWGVMGDVKPVEQVEVQTGVSNIDKLNSVRGEMAKNDVVILENKKVKDDKLKTIKELEAEISKLDDAIVNARDSNRELEKMRVQIINGTEQVIYQNTGAVSSGLQTTTE